MGLLESGNYFDSELYETSGSKSSKYEGYVTSIAPNDDGDDDDDVGMPMPSNNGQAKRAFNPVAHAMKEIVQVSRQQSLDLNDLTNFLVISERARLRPLCGTQTTHGGREGGRVQAKAPSLGYIAGASGSLCRRYVSQTIRTCSIDCVH